MNHAIMLVCWLTLAYLARLNLMFISINRFNTFPWHLWCIYVFNADTMAVLFICATSRGACTIIVTNWVFLPSSTVKPSASCWPPVGWLHSYTPKLLTYFPISTQNCRFCQYISPNDWGNMHQKLLWQNAERLIAMHQHVGYTSFPAPQILLSPNPVILCDCIRCMSVPQQTLHHWPTQMLKDLWTNLVDSLTSHPDLLTLYGRKLTLLLYCSCPF